LQAGKDVRMGQMRVIAEQVRKWQAAPMPEMPVPT